MCSNSIIAAALYVLMVGSPQSFADNRVSEGLMFFPFFRIIYFVIELIKRTSDSIARLNSISKVFKSSKIGIIIFSKEYLLFDFHLNNYFFIMIISIAFFYDSQSMISLYLLHTTILSGIDIINIETGSGGVIKEEAIKIKINRVSTVMPHK